MKEKLRRTLALLCSSLMLGTGVVGLAACDGCDDEETNGNGSCAHQWDDGVVEREADCYKDGEKVLTCGLCGETKTEVIPGGHDYQQSVVAATCLRDGTTTYTCSRCGDEHKDITTRALGHDTVNALWASGDDAKVSGCTYNHVETAKCNKCGETVTHTEEFENHTWAVTIKTPATCKTAGEKTYRCSAEECGEEISLAYTDENAHKWVESTTQSGTENVITYVCAHDSSHTKTVYSAKTVTAATVPSAALKEAGEVELQNAAIKMPESVLSQLGDSDVDISVTEADKDSLSLSPEDKEKLGNAPVFDFSMSTAGNAVSNFNGKVTVTVPYNLQSGEDPENIAIWYIADNGQTETIAATYSYNADEMQGYATFETDHFSYYTVIRMSPAERCAFYGHDEVTETIAPSCNQQGYTKTECTRCHKLTRSNFTAALTHNYASTVKAPTCSEKGYTTNTCTLCGDKYISNYVATTAHTFKEETKEATCTAGGYTMHTCEVCHYSYVDKETPLKDHTYANGSCSVCGRKDPNVSGNFYLNFAESLLTAKTYYVEMSNFTVKYHDGYENVEEHIDYAKLVVGVDDTGLVGKGEVRMTMTENHRGHEYKMKEDSVVVLRDGMIYVYVEATDEADGAKDTYKLVNWIDQKAMIGLANISSGSGQMRPSPDNGGEQGGNVGGDIIIEEGTMPKAASEEMGGEAMSWTNIIAMLEANSEDISALIKGIQNQENSPLNSMLQGIIEYFFKKEATQDGYTFTLDKTRAHAIFTTFTQAKGAKFFDNIYGDGEFEAFVTMLKDTLAKTVAEIETDVVAELARWGINKDTLYKIIENVTGATVEQLLADYKEEPLYTILNGVMGEEMAVEDYQGMVDEYASMLRDNTVLELITPFFAETGVEITDELVEEVGNMIQANVNKLANSYAQFKTDKAGWLISYDMHIDNFEFEEEIDGVNVSVFANGDMKFVINGTYAGDYENLVKIVEKLSGVLDVENAVDTEDATIFTMGDDTFVWMKKMDEEDYYWNYYITYFMENTKEVVESNVTYNGKVCDKVQIAVRNLWKLEEDFAMSMQEDCTGWWGLENCDVEIQEVVQVYIYQDAQGNILGMELVNPEEWKGNHWHDINLYYNPSTGEYATQSQHNYKLVETVPEKGCVLGKYVYNCSVCGNEMIETFGEGHRIVGEGVLAAGATSCEDGVTITQKCVRCNEVISVYNRTYHERFYQETKVGHSDVCGDVYLAVYTCACGEDQMFSGSVGNNWGSYEIGVIGDCQFDYMGDGLYRCAVLNCGFEYTHTTDGEYVRENGTCYLVKTETYVFPEKTYTYTDKWEDHDTTWSRITDAEGYIVETGTCRLCGEVTRQTKEKYDQWGRTIEYIDVLSGYRYVRVYDEHCNYEETTYYEDGSTDTSTGTQHASWTSGYTDRNCTQYYQYHRTCSACGTTKSEWRAPEYYYWYDGYYVGHDWYYDDLKETYVCRDCGTENPLGTDALITLEDRMSGGIINVGYYNYRDIDMSAVDIEIILNCDENGYGIELDDALFTNTDTTPESGPDMDEDWYGYYKESGIITVDMDALYNAIAATEDGGTDVTSVSVVFWVERSSVTGGEPFLLAHVLTYDMSELAA